MRRGDPLPPLWLAPGALSDPRPLARHGPLDEVVVPIGPVVPGAVPTPARIFEIGIGGLEHGDATVGQAEAVDLLQWCSGRLLRTCLAVRGRTTGDLVEAVGLARRSIDADTIAAVEVDLRGADDQHCLKALARVRESVPRDLLLLTRLSAQQPDLVAAARGAVAGGAGAVVVCGSVPLGGRRWWSGPSTLAVTAAGVRRLRDAAVDQRWPGAPLVAAGGIHDARSAGRVLHDGAQALQLGTALWADPTILWQLIDDVRSVS